MHRDLLHLFLMTAFLLFILLLSRADVEGHKVHREQYEQYEDDDQDLDNLPCDDLPHEGFATVEGNEIKCPAFNPIEPRGTTISDRPRPPMTGLADAPIPI